MLPRWLPRFVREWLVHPHGRRFVKDMARLVPAERRPACRVLDAGCGTGEIASLMARSFPWREVVAVDVTPSSLELARRFADTTGARIDFRLTDLHDAGAVASLGQFDVIMSLGVLHHLPDPGVGLANLARALAPDGVMLLYLYASHARGEYRRRRSIIESLVPDPADLEGRLRVMHELGFVRRDKRPVRGWILRRLGVDTEAVAESRAIDDLVNVCERTYSAREVVDLIEGAGLEVSHWFRGLRADFDGLLPPAQRQVAEALPGAQRLELLENLLTPAAFVVGLRRARAG